MRWLLRPTIWLSGRLNFSRKYVLIAALVMLALSMLSWPLLRQVRTDIQLAELERNGLGQIGKQWQELIGPVLDNTETC